MSGKPAAELFAAAAPRVYSIDPGRPFLIDLAGALHGAADSDPSILADTTVFLPTRRAARALMDALAKTAPARASLLPRLQTLGDIDEDALELAAGGVEPAHSLDLPPSVSPAERRLVLARLVAAADRVFAGQENWPAAIAAADELGRLLDSFYAEEIDLARLKEAAPADHAAHWARSLKFLEIVTLAWPAYLRERGLIDPAERRALLVARQAEHLEKTSPSAPVIVAGTTGSAPAVARLMRVVSRLRNGAVVLPGLDRDLARDEKAWSAVDDPHPQAGLKAVLAALGVDASMVRQWLNSPAPSPRSALISLALRPAEATDDWRKLVERAAARDPKLERACAGLTFIAAANEDAEAGAISILMREALETPGRTAILATPDRHLARRVAAKMRRWGVMIGDSAGVPFANSPCGVYLRLAAHWLAAPSDPAATMSIARHPMARFGLNEAQKARALDALDEGLRGPMQGAGVDGFERKLAANDRLAERASPILKSLRNARELWPIADEAPFGEYLNAHLAAAEALSAAEEETGAQRLWRGEDGETGAALLADLHFAATALERIGARDYAHCFAQLVAGPSVRDRATHPRLAILGPLEARLQSADLVILGGLNEGVWPAEAAVDSFLSRKMREAIGLPSPERRLGLSSHDFAQLASAPEVALTRARVAGGAPARPSRWVVRLTNILEGAGALAAIDETARLAGWAAHLDQPGDVTPVLPPEPRPPFEARPRRLPVTRFENLIRDPYSVYARDILQLKALEPLGAPTGRAQIGLLLHAVFEQFVMTGQDPNETDARARLTAILDATAPHLGVDAAASAFWQARLDAALDWFLAWDRERRTVGAPAVVESAGEHTFDIGAAPFTLTARADRIDLLADGGAAIFDYKSGALRTLNQIKADFSPQLPLTALIVEAGGFAAIGARTAHSFHYVKALGQKGDARDFSGAEGVEARAEIEATRAGFAVLVAAFDDPSTPYLSQPRPQFLKEYADYDHLARRREWASAEEGE